MNSIPASAMALTAVLFAQQFGYPILRGATRVAAQVGLAMIALGVVAMTGVYLVAGFNNWAPPTWFVSGANGIASDDVVTGILVMGGGLVIGVALVIGHFGTGTSLLGRPVRLAALWSWVLSFATVVIAGYAIEMNETYFGAGDPKASGATKDALFTWLHQDIGLFMLPSLVLVMLAVELLVHEGHPSWIGWTTIVGTTTAFVGGLIWVFFDPALHGPGYVVSTIGLLIVGCALLATLWWGAFYHQPSVPTQATQRGRLVHFPMRIG
ncbi:MAG TPA: hypothetical protein VF898_02070, partial [Chloroflexota bacterium]